MGRRRTDRAARPARRAGEGVAEGVALRAQFEHRGATQRVEVGANGDEPRARGRQRFIIETDLDGGAAVARRGVLGVDIAETATRRQRRHRDLDAQGDRTKHGVIVPALDGAVGIRKKQGEAIIVHGEKYKVRLPRHPRSAKLHRARRPGSTP